MQYQRILKQVSRSFYLSMQYLPRTMRVPVMYAYMFARIGDTIADSAASDTALRLELLTQLRDFIAAIDKPLPTAVYSSWQQQVNTMLLPLIVNSNERKLLQKSTAILQEASAVLPVVAMPAVQQVSAIIFEGHSDDLVYFEQQQLRAFSKEKQVLTYCYQVAGCVGEFWTQLIALQYRGIDAKLYQLGVAMGQGLQLVNIIRDFAEDLQRQRIYLPRLVNANLQDAKQCLQYWQQQAQQFLLAGQSYVRLLPSRRIAFASYLPILLAQETLALLVKKNFGLPTSLPVATSWQAVAGDCQQVKISRQTVYRSVRQAVAELYLNY